MCFFFFFASQVPSGSILGYVLAEYCVGLSDHFLVSHSGVVAAAAVLPSPVFGGLSGHSAVAQAAVWESELRRASLAAGSGVASAAVMIPSGISHLLLSRLLGSAPWGFASVAASPVTSWVFLGFNALASTQTLAQCVHGCLISRLGLCNQAGQGLCPSIGLTARCGSSGGLVGTSEGLGNSSIGVRR